MQRAGFAAAGLEGWSYDLLDVPPDGLAQAVAGLRDNTIAGANVTIPHKQAVIGLLDGLEGGAEEIGAVNTIRRDGRRLIGSNTDVAGIRAALAAVTFEPGRAVILGAGGSARAAAAALRESELVFVARSPEKSDGLPGLVLPWTGRAWLDAVERADLLLNATPLGRAGELPVAAEILPPAVVDLVYVTGGTKLVQAARERGLRAADGWEVLLAQGAAAFQAWTGRPAPITAMKAALPA